jgi:hypothetical protein
LNSTNTNTPLFKCLSGGTLEISMMTFKKLNSESLVSSSGIFSIESVIITSESNIIHTSGLLYIDSTNHLSILSTTIEKINLNNKAIFEFGNNKPSSLTIDNCQFKDISRSGNSGGSVVRVNIPSTVTNFDIKNSIFDNCISYNSGGALYLCIAGKNCLIEGCKFTTCKVSNYINYEHGGAIYVFFFFHFFHFFIFSFYIILFFFNYFYIVIRLQIMVRKEDH